MSGPRRETWIEAMERGETDVHEYCEPAYTDTEAAHVLDAVGERGGMRPGSFAASLLQTMFKADRLNLVKLANAFPRWGAAVFDYRYGGGTRAMLVKAQVGVCASPQCTYPPAYLGLCDHHAKPLRDAEAIQAHEGAVES